MRNLLKCQTISLPIYPLKLLPSTIFFNLSLLVWQILQKNIYKSYGFDLVLYKLLLIIRNSLGNFWKS